MHAWTLSEVFHELSDHGIIFSVILRRITETFWSQSFCFLNTDEAPIETIRTCIESQEMK